MTESDSVPTPRNFPKDPSIVQYGLSQSIVAQDEDYYEENENELQSNDQFEKETEGYGDQMQSRNLNISTRCDNLSVNLVRKSSTTTESNGATNWLNVSSNGIASNYFERSLIEEFNHLIEEEQRDSSVLSIPMVPAMLDDATTLVSVAPQTSTASAVGQQQQPEISVQSNRTHHPSPGIPNNQSVASQGARTPQPSPPVRRQPQPIVQRQLPMRQLSALRQEYGLPVGIVMEVARYQKCAYTFFVCDTNNIEDDCLQECAHLATAAHSEIVFCLGNASSSQELLYPPPTDPRMTEIQRQSYISTALHNCIATIRNTTWSTTPIEWTIQKLYDLSQRIPRLEYWQREKISVVLVTNRTFGYNGQPELTHFVNAIRALQQIHVQITIRLSTKDENVVQYYNSMKQPFPSISMISTFDRQKALVQKYNPWFHYGQPLHRLRELGYHFHHTIDLISQRKLNKDELRVFFVEFYGKKAMLYSPDVFTEWDVFYRFIDTINNREGKHRLGLNTKNKEYRDYWINVRKLSSAYAERRRGSFPWLSAKPRSLLTMSLSKLDQDSLRVEL
jgi:hypothetical protein